MIAALLLVFSSTAHADAPTAWVKARLGGHLGVELPGVTPKGQPCLLGLIDREEGRFFVVVQLDTPDRTDEDYYGVQTLESRAQKSARKLEWTSQHSWGNRSSVNVVTIETTPDERPVRAIGESDLGTLVCMLGESPTS